MKRVDSRTISPRPSEIRCFCLGRNEARRIPEFLAYHKALGVDRFFYIDNDSEDESVDRLLAHDAVHVWRTTQPYQESRFGVDWQHALLKQFGVGHWCLLLDLDEFFYYPYCDQGRSFEDFIGSLERDNYTAVKSMMLDMYSDRGIDETELQPDTSIFDTCPFFDRPRYLSLFFTRDFQRLQKIYFQGVRQRVFNTSANVRKYVFLKYSDEMVFTPGHHHYRSERKRLARERTYLFHFKFLKGLAEYSRESIARKCHWNTSSEYKTYLSTMENEPPLNLYAQGTSIRYSDTATFLENGMIRPPGRGRDLAELCAAVLSRILK